MTNPATTSNTPVKAITYVTVFAAFHRNRSKSLTCSDGANTAPSAAVAASVTASTGGPLVSMSNFFEEHQYLDNSQSN
jgi:C1A family cysteine protease